MNPATDRLSSALADRYRIERTLGQGGMATVYLAADLKHDRKVAIKVLKPELAAVLGAERFVQEIKTTAALSHPHILPLFDSGEAGGFLYYVMPYIEGETVREKLTRETQFGIEEAVKITTEVADALDYAHRHGVIHRDIKPENILLHDGRPMVMDFGIALAVSAAAGGRMTETGLSLGTPHYMSPEQATADKQITARSDIYSLASVLYEMLAGEPPHMGNSAQQIIMKIIAEPVQPVTELRKSVPPNVAAAIAKALEKMPADRFDSARHFAEALGNVGFTVTTAAAGARGVAGLATVRRWKRVAIGVGALALLVIATLITTRPKVGPPPVMYVDLPMPDNVTLYVSQGINFDIAPDGSAAVFVGGGSAELWLRRLDRLDAVKLQGTANARNPRFSPDGKSVAFIAGRSLNTMAVTGAPPFAVVADSVAGGGGNGGLAWGRDGYLYFRYVDGGVARVAAGGGTPERLAAGDSTGAASWFDVLPNGRGLIYSLTGSSAQQTRIAVLDLRSRQSKVLLQGTVARFAAPRELLYSTAQGRLFSVDFDPDRLKVAGDPRPVLGGIQVNVGSATYFATSASGALLYATGSANLGIVLSWLADGSAETLMPIRLPPTADLSRPAVSPSGKRIAFRVAPGISTSPDAGDVWVYDVTQMTAAPVTSTGKATAPFWKPGEREIGYVVAEAGGGHAIYTVPSDLSGSPRMLLPVSAGAISAAWTPDGRALVYADTAGHIRYAPTSSPGTSIDVTGPVLGRSRSLYRTYFSVSPDGRWVAFDSRLSGSSEVYVAPLPGPGGRLPVSAGGGLAPRWTRDGASIMYLEPGGNTRWTVASVRTVPDFAVTSRRPFAGGGAFLGDYDVAPDGRIVAERYGSESGAVTNEMRLITDWRRWLTTPR